MSCIVLYLAHDLSDPAIRRRVLMLKAGGAEVSVAGFQRDDTRLTGDVDLPVVVLGKTSDGRLGQRVGAVVKARVALRRLLTGLKKPDIIIARNLEMLALSGAASNLFGSVPVVYECLDIHRLLLDRGIKGRLLRAAEGHFGRSASALVTSSPAFVENYFRPISSLDLPILLLENQVLELSPPSKSRHRGARPPSPGEPWRIGWFGAIRCRKSFETLARFTKAMGGKVEVIIRGRISPKEFPDFQDLLNSTPNISFLGSYRNPEDLSSIYDQVQFVWAIDFFEEGLNSEWLLPNRLYEGALHGAIPIALSSTETGRYLARLQLGLLLDDAHPQSLTNIFERLERANYHVMASALERVDPAHWTIDKHGCEAVVKKLVGIKVPA